MSKTTVSIIGSAGRKDDGERMSAELFAVATNECAKLINGVWQLDWNELELVSGGAAWMDHIAVSLWMMDCGADLCLHLPCGWDNKNRKFVDNDKPQFWANPGRTANKYHREFSKKMGFDTLDALDAAITISRNHRSNVTVKRYSGFKQRNKPVAESDYVIALTFGDGDKPKDGGTSHTWGLAKGTKIHIPLGDLLVSGV